MDLRHQPFLVVGSLLIVVWVMPAQGPAGAACSQQPQAGPDLAQAFPAEVLVYVESAGLGDFLRGLPQADFWRSLRASRLGRQLLTLPQTGELMAGLVFLELLAGEPPAQFLGKAVGERLAVALLPAEQPILLAAVEFSERDRAARVLEVLENLLQQSGSEGLVKSRVIGGEIWSLNDELFLAPTGRVVLISSSRSSLDESLRRLGGTEQASLSTCPALLRLRQNPVEALRGFLARPLLGLIPDRLDQPLLSLWLGDFLEFSRRAKNLYVSFAVSAEGLVGTLEWPVDPAEVEPHGLHFGHQAKNPLLLFNTDKDLLSLSVRRRLADWWEQRARYLIEGLDGDFINTESQLAQFFGGKNFVEEILANFHEDMVLVVTRQTYPQVSEPPKVRFPGGALLLRPKKPEVLTDLAIALHSLLGIINIERGQQGKTPLLIYSEPLAGSTLYGARFLDRDHRAADAARYNLSPALIQVGEWLVLATADEVIRDLLPQLQERTEPSSLPSSVTAHGRIDGPLLEKILADNRDILLANATLESGKSPAAARRDLDALLLLPTVVESLEWSGRTVQGEAQLELCVRWGEALQQPPAEQGHGSGR
jgi:hypothetical protein